MISYYNNILYDGNDVAAAAGLSNRAHEGEKLGCQKCQNQNKMMRKAEKKSR